MNRGFSAVVAVWSAIALPGCGTSSGWQTDESVAPISYSAVLADEMRTIGNLRRVLLVPVEVPPPARCGERGSTDWSVSNATHGSSASSFLTRERGYEVAVASDPGILSKVGLSEGDLRQLVAPLRNCAADRSQWTPTPPSAREAAIMLGKHGKVDAVLLVERAEVCESETATKARKLGFELPWITSERPGEPYTGYVRAVMFETTSGRLIWYRELSTGALWSKALAASSPFTAPRPYGGTGLPWSTISDEMKWLLEGIEPAIPQEITR